MESGLAELREAQSFTDSFSPQLGEPSQAGEVGQGEAKLRKTRLISRRAQTLFFTL